MKAIWILRCGKDFLASLYAIRGVRYQSIFNMSEQTEGTNLVEFEHLFSIII